MAKHVRDMQEADPSNIVKVRKGPQRMQFTRQQWEALGPEKGGWVIDPEVPQAVRDLEERKALEAKRDALYGRISELHAEGFGVHIGDQLDENGDGIPEAVTYISKYGDIKIPVAEIQDIPAEAWPYVKGGYISRLQSVKMLESALATHTTAPTPIQVPTAPVDTTEDEATEKPAKAAKAEKEPESDTTAKEAKADKKAAEKATKKATDEGKE